MDLFASYGLTQKAIGLLEAILRRAPMHTPTLEKLLDFVLGAGDDRRTAELAAHLEHIHAQRGDTRSSERFGELRRRFQRAAGLTDDEIAAAVAAAMPQPVEAVPFEEADSGGRELALPKKTSPKFPWKLRQTKLWKYLWKWWKQRQWPGKHSAPEAVEELPEIEIIEEAAEPQAQPQAESTEEVDLSSEWSSLLEETQASTRAR